MRARARRPQAGTSSYKLDRLRARGASDRHARARFALAPARQARGSVHSRPWLKRKTEAMAPTTAAARLTLPLRSSGLWRLLRQRGHMRSLATRVFADDATVLEAWRSAVPAAFAADTLAMYSSVLGGIVTDTGLCLTFVLLLSGCRCLSARMAVSHLSFALSLYHTVALTLCLAVSRSAALSPVPLLP